MFGVSFDITFSPNQRRPTGATELIIESDIEVVQSYPRRHIPRTTYAAICMSIRRALQTGTIPSDKSNDLLGREG